MYSLESKVIIVTGAGGNVGWQYAQGMIDAGAFVDLWDVSADRLTALKSLLTSKQLASARFSQVDITNVDSVKQAVETLVTEKGKIDGLVNNAAMNPSVEQLDASGAFSPYEDYPLALWEKELHVNLTGTLICTQAVAKIMIKQSFGSIVNVASEVSIVAHDHRLYQQEGKFKSIGYVTTKAALLGFTRQWAARLGSHHVRVNAFSPSGMKADSMPEDFVQRYGATTMLGRMANAGEYTGPVIFLCSDASSFMTGQNLIVDGGKSAW